MLVDKSDWVQLANELHKPIRRKFEKRRVIITGKNSNSPIDNTWTADLVDMQPYSRWNKGYKYLQFLMFFQNMLGLFQSKIKKVKQSQMLLKEL